MFYEVDSDSTQSLMCPDYFLPDQINPGSALQEQYLIGILHNSVQYHI